MRLVVVESPYAGHRGRNTRYARACMADCLARGEAPFASHLLYTQPGVLRDDDPAERELGITAGIYWGGVASLRAVYMDLGISAGMQRGIDAAKALAQAIEYRELGGEWRDSESTRPCPGCGSHQCAGCIDDARPKVR